jgi:hypothetical protein
MDNRKSTQFWWPDIFSLVLGQADRNKLIFGGHKNAAENDLIFSGHKKAAENNVLLRNGIFLATENNMLFVRAVVEKTLNLIQFWSLYSGDNDYVSDKAFLHPHKSLTSCGEAQYIIQHLYQICFS